MELASKPPILARTLVIAAIAMSLVWYVARAFSGIPTPPSAPLPFPTLDATLAPQSSTQIAIFAGGCFWGTQAVFQHVGGVQEVTAGYCGGHIDHPYYQLVCSGSTGHAESVRVVYDPSKITYGRLLMVFFGVAHDPTQNNRQGPDVGSQYRSAIFFTTEEQQKIASQYITQLNAAKIFRRPIATQLVAAPDFYDAEDYHQDYLVHHMDDGYIRAVDLPKLDRLKHDFPQFYH
jgi:peptide-methionine (S)-S-oxide reductase